jgi:cobalt-zinc-cadmium efflux system membrane fusion protein
MNRAALVASSLFLAACGSACSSSEAKPSPPVAREGGPLVLKLDVAMLGRLGVVSGPVGSGGAAERIELPGTLEYVIDQYAEVGTLVEGRVSNVSVNVGDRVKKGQPLATVLVPAIVNAQADALSAQAALRVATEHAKREAMLLKQQLTTAREEEVARGEADRAEADLAAAESKLRLLGSSSPATAQGIKPNGTVVLATPLDGVVVRREIVLGAFVLPNETAFVIANTESLWAVLDVYESDLTFIREGAEVDLRVDALPGEKFKGKVAMLEPEVAKGTRALRARIIVDNRAGTLRQGFFVRAEVPVAQPPEEGLIVPSAAVQPLGERSVVFVEKEPGRYEVRTVTVGRKTQHVAMVTGGLERGERIVTRGAFVLRGEATRQ